MNGEQQKERATAIARLEKIIEQMEKDMIDLALQTRRDYEKDDGEIRADLLAETNFRKSAVIELLMKMEENRKELATLMLEFIMLPWYRRLAWMFFGPAGLDYFGRPKPKTPPDKPTQTDGQANADGRL